MASFTKQGDEKKDQKHQSAKKQFSSLTNSVVLPQKHSEPSAKIDRLAYLQ